MDASLQKYLRLAGFQTRARWALVVVLAVVVSGAEAFGALLVYLLLGVVTGVEDTLAVPLLGDLRQWLPVDDRRSLLLWTAAVIGGFFVLRAVLVLIQRYVTARVTQSAGARLSARLADGYLALPYAFHLQRNSSELIRNAYSTVQDVVTDVFRPALKILAESMIVLAILLVLLISAPLATLLVIAVVAPVAVLLLRFVYPRLLALGIEKQRANQESLQSLQQSLSGLRDIKVLGREHHFSNEFRGTRERLARVFYLREVFRDIPNVSLETLIVLLIAGLFAGAVVLEGEAVGAIPLLGLFGYAAVRLKPSLSEIIQGVNLLRFSHGGIDDIFSDLALVEEFETSRPDDTQPTPFTRDVVLDGVSFRYEGAATDALAGIDLRIPKGGSVGIIGPTGGGKTTLVDIITGLLEPTSGAVLVDGLDVRTDVAGWQRNLGIVPQSLFLIDDTLRRNIALGVPDEEIDDELVTQATELAQMEDVVADLPDGLETLVGEGGVRLSGGQRQRVAIARALYRRPEVLIFDEGTSALDMETESQVLQALEAIRSNYTLITVAHRLATVRDCDEVVLVKRGRIADRGTLRELTERNGLLAEPAG